MNISEYGKELSIIGKKISGMSNYNKKENNISEKLKNNILICEDIVHQFKEIKPPLFMGSEHLELANIFEQLITVYSNQLKSINDVSEVVNMELFLNGKNLEKVEMEKLGSILLSLLTKCSCLIFNNNLQL